MNETNEMWRGVKADRRARLDAKEPSRVERFARLLRHPDIIVRRRLGEYGWRLSHYEWPRGQWVDFWPRTSAVRTSDGRSMKGWVRLLKALGIRRGDWERGDSAVPRPPSDSD